MFTSIIRRFNRVFEAMRRALVRLTPAAELPEPIEHVLMPKGVLSVIPVVCHTLKAGVRHRWVTDQYT